MITYREFFKRRSEGETVKSISESIGKGTRRITASLNRGGWHSRGSGNDQKWVYEGEVPEEEMLDKEMLFGRQSSTSNPSSKPKNKPSKNTENKQINKTEKKKVGNPESKSVMTKKVTYEIEGWIHEEIRIRSIREKKNVSDIVNEILKGGL